MTLCLIGGDQRIQLLPRFLAEKCLAAEPQVTSRDGLYKYLESLMDKSDAVILPIPVTRDGKALFAPHFSAKAELEPLLDFSESKNIPVLGGCVPDSLNQKYANIFDYAKSERFLVQNAKLTAEGTLAEIIEHSDKTLYGSEILITGGGRIATELVRLLKPFSDNITVTARRDKVRAEFIHSGVNATDTSDLSLDGYDFIINTVPHLLIDESALKTAKADAMLFDLATSPCGIDFDAAKELNLSAFLLPGLPGKYSPAAAARAIADEIEIILKGNDII